MLYRINGEEAFQIGAPNMTISPSSQGYELQISADGYNFTTLFSVDANTTRMVTGVANGSYYRLLGNEDDIIINAMVQWDGETTTPIEDSISVVAESASVTVKPSEGYDGFKEATVDYSSLLDAYYQTGKLDVDANATEVTMVENETKTATISDNYKGYYKYIVANVPDDEIVSLTQEEYDALTVKKPHTYYFIGEQGNWTTLMYNSIPVYPPEPKENFLQFTAVDGDVDLYISKGNVMREGMIYSFAYSLDGVNFSNWKVGEEYKVTVPNGSTLYVSGECPNGTTTYTGYQDSGVYTFKFNTSNSGKAKLSGKLNRLLGYGKQDATSFNNGSFANLFRDCAITDASELILGLTSLNSWVYTSMFRGCSSLVTAPELPATTLAYGCYYEMFNGCSSLTTAPELPATTLAGYCYSSMFSGCTSLTTAPELPATTLATKCYFWMFWGCSSLVTAPELPATTLAGDCYNGMFYGCTSLVTAPELPATTLANRCYYRMFNYCTSLVTTPELPATTLEYGCYDEMFYDCYSLKEVKAYFTDFSASECLDDWLTSTSSNGTFYGNNAMTEENKTTFTSIYLPSTWTAEWKDVS